MSERVKFYLDEHVNPAVASGLRRRGVDVLTTQEAGMLSTSDEDYFSRYETVFRNTIGCPN